MAAHTQFPPAGAEAIVRGDPASFVIRFMVAGVDQDISAWTFRSFVRNRIDGDLVSTCEDFEVVTSLSLPDLYPTNPTSVPSVLICRWTVEQTLIWQSGYVADIEQLTPAKRTWLIIDQLRIDRDVSYTTEQP